MKTNVLALLAGVALASTGCSDAVTDGMSGELLGDASAAESTTGLTGSAVATTTTPTLTTGDGGGLAGTNGLAPPTTGVTTTTSALPDGGLPLDPVDASAQGMPDCESDPTLPACAEVAADAGAPGAVDGQAPSEPSGCDVAPIPDDLRQSFRLDTFYTRHALMDGIPIVASDAPSDESIRRACFIVGELTSEVPEVRETMRNTGMHFAMMATSETLANIPEVARYGVSDQRARGLATDEFAVCAEENVMCEGYPADRWGGESICFHEYSHAVAGGGWGQTVPGFSSRLSAAFDSAKRQGLFANTYADDNSAEYLAEGVQDWFNTNLESAPPNGVHNEINTRTELEAYDPDLYQLLSEVLPETPTYDDCYYYGE